MRVAHVAPTALSSISAAWRIRRAQEQIGVDAFALVHRGTPGAHVTLLRAPGRLTTLATRLEAHLEALPLVLSRPRDRALPFSTGWTGYAAAPRINEEHVDVVNLHWASWGSLSLRDLRHVRCPVVMTMHDVWGLTAGCHCNLGCERWRDGCHECPQLADGPGGLRVDHALWRWKRHAYAGIGTFAVVTPSQWLGAMARQSPLVAGRRVEVIPNCLDLATFRPAPQAEARRALGLPLDRRVLLFGAADATRVTYKGYHLLVEALERLRQLSSAPYHLLVFGADGDPRPLPYPATFLGTLHDEPALARAYQAADVFVAPSQQDNLPNTLLEASGCGVPMVGFHVGGIPEIIRHRQGGWVAAAFDTEDFARGIAWASDPERAAALGRDARAHAERSYASQVVARQYLALYEALVAGHGWPKVL